MFNMDWRATDNALENKFQILGRRVHRLDPLSLPLGTSKSIRLHLIQYIIIVL